MFTRSFKTAHLACVSDRDIRSRIAGDIVVTRDVRPLRQGPGEIHSLRIDPQEVSLDLDGASADLALLECRTFRDRFDTPGYGGVEYRAVVSDVRCFGHDHYIITWDVEEDW